MIRDFLLVGMGGAVGAMLRYSITLLCQYFSWSGHLGTLLTNVVGSLCMGMLTAHFQQSPLLLMATVGVCGGFTTYSTFSMQSVSLLQQGKYGLALLYMVGTMLSCVLFAALGYILGRR